MPILLQKNFPDPVRDATSLIEHRLKEGRGTSFIHIVPTNRRVRDAERKYLRALPRQASERFLLFTLETLAVELFTLLCPPRRLVDGPSQAVVFHHAMINIASSLRYFKLHSGSRFLHRGTFQKIINVINKLKNEGVYPSLLQIELEGVGSDEEPKLRDILAIYEEYEHLLGTEYIDSAGYLKSVNEQWDDRVGDRVLQYFQGADLIVISGFDKFSDPEITMLSGLTSLRNFGTVISFDYFSDNDRVFGHLEENYKKFIQLGFKKTAKQYFSADEFTLHIAKHFISHDRKPPCPDLSRKVSVCQAPTRRDEVELIAKIIKRLVHDESAVRLSKICVAMFQPKLYTNLFHEIFPAYGIPANITDRFPLDQSPCIIALLSLLTVQEHNFRLRDIMRALTTPYFSFGEGKDKIDAGNLCEIGTALKVPAGFRTWTTRIERRLEEVQRDLMTVDDDIEAWHLTREQDGLSKAIRDLRHLAGTLSPFTIPLRPQEFRERVRALFEDLHVVENIMSVSTPSLGDHQREKDARALQKFLYFLDEYLDVLQSEHGTDTPQPLTFYLDTLRTAIPHIRYNIRQKWGYGVLVTTLEETRELDFDVMIIAGLVDGEFPPLYQPEILVSKKRQDISEHFHPVEHRYLFYQVATNFRNRLYLTMPQRDAHRQLLPSSYIDALASIVQLDDMRGHIPPELEDPIFSKSELLRHAGTMLNFSESESLERILDLPVDEEIRETFEHMRLAVRVERCRLEKSEVSPYGGMIFGNLHPHAAMALQSLRDRVYSVTQLESYGKCPFQFFADKVLKLNVPMEIERGVSPMERGAVVHDILFDFYIDRRKKNMPLLSRCNDADFARAVDDLWAIAKAKLERFGGADVLWNIEKERMLGATGRKGILNEFLEYERSRDYTVRPAYFEVAFGSKVGARKSTDPDLTLSEPVSVNNVLLRGKIDRVDLGEGIAKIIDYKTGSTGFHKDEIESGMSLQLPIYLYVIERILADHLGQQVIPAAGVYYNITSPVKEEIAIASGEHRGMVIDKNTRSRNLVPTDEDLRSVIGKAVDFVNSYVENIANGIFPVEPKDVDRVCGYCNFNTVCRIRDSAVPDREPSPDNHHRS
jgi:ATP-dependent helicase/nuclease subunit B